mmetsp:Transcript_23665/g.35090  ORF Transcript_23665/g.35090 Transcript_23665/m.35090 type:complete len:127 (+) Transcript_23665:28-408(+)
MFSFVLVLTWLVIFSTLENGFANSKLRGLPDVPGKNESESLPQNAAVSTRYHFLCLTQSSFNVFPPTLLCRSSKQLHLFLLLLVIKRKEVLHPTPLTSCLLEVSPLLNSQMLISLKCCPRPSLKVP